MRTIIYPNDTVRHKPTGEEWIVAGVNHMDGTLVPCGYPFPTIAKIEDCELIKEGYEIESQSAELIKEFLQRGMQNFVDARSAMWHGLLPFDAEDDDESIPDQRS